MVDNIYIYGLYWLVKKGIPRSWTITIPNILASIIPQLIINQPGFVSHCSSGTHDDHKGPYLVAHPT